MLVKQKGALIRKRKGVVEVGMELSANATSEEAKPLAVKAAPCTPVFLSPEQLGLLIVAQRSKRKQRVSKKQKSR